VSRMQSLPPNPFGNPTVVAGYEAWYETTGRRADTLEKALLGKLLKRLPEVHSALEVGCGTGHFTRWLAGEGLWTVGLDISPAMLAQARRLQVGPRGCPYARGDGLALPFPDRAFDLVALVTTLEFMPQPVRAVAEAGRVARRGVLLGGLNGHSVMALRRRWRSLWKPTLYDQAHFYCVSELGQMAREALGARLVGLSWRTTLLPGPWARADSRLPWGGFVGMLLELEAEDGG
jgi:ubiquinone/menaquinone biosynthesis C-methylase UbiE